MKSKNVIDLRPLLRHVAAPPSERLQVHAPDPSTATQWLGHVKRWEACQLCPIGSCASKHVFGRGHLACDYVLVGEGPGKAEDVLGAPFVGRSGQLLDDALAEADACPFDTDGDGNCPRHPDGCPARKFFLMNLVACRPTDTRGGANRQPNDAEVQHCKKRFAETMAHATPKRGIVLLGRVPQHYFPYIASALPAHLQKVRVFAVRHPAAILRNWSEEKLAEYVRDFQHIFQGEQR